MSEDVKEMTQLNENVNKLTDRQKIYALLRTSGLTQADTARALKITPQSACNLEKRVNKQVKKLSHDDLTSSFFATPARKSLKKIIQGKKFGDIDKMPAGIVLDAIKMVKEEISPTIKQAHITHDSVLSPQVIDVTPSDKGEPANE